VIANENNPKGALAGILSLSSVIIVSGESISMVSEAVSSGKKTIVFMPDKKKSGMTKHERALMNLAQDGYIAIARSGELISLVARALKDNTPAKKVDDTDKIYEAMRVLI
jgi:mitochondrial fission protein ELM1